MEELGAKKALFAELEGIVGTDCMLASNSSSLTPTAMAAGLAHPGRLVGLHFFNPVPAMKLVEVISGLATDPEVADAAAELAAGWGKTVVRSAATPGFIVNRIARPFYAEAWRLYEEHATTAAAIDAVLTGAGGFRMGPFALMDLIGHDVNEAVTRSVWAAFGHDPRFAPSLAQRVLVEAGWLGRKTGRGIYSYADPATAAAAPAPAAARPLTVIEYGHDLTDNSKTQLRELIGRSLGVAVIARDRDDAAAGLPDGLLELPSGALLIQCAGATATALSAAFERPVIVVDRMLDPAKATAIAVAPSDGCPPAALAETIGLFQAGHLNVFVIDDVPGLIVTRTVAMLANLAADALASRVASEADIDTAMRLGVNYPLGPLAWAREWGTSVILGSPGQPGQLVSRRPLPGQPPAPPRRAVPANPRRRHSAPAPVPAGRASLAGIAAGRPVTAWASSHPGETAAGAATDAGRGGRVPPNSGHSALCRHQSHRRLGLGRQSPDTRARSIACHSASTLRCVARRSASSGEYRRTSPSDRYISCSMRGMTPCSRQITSA